MRRGLAVVFVVAAAFAVGAPVAAAATWMVSNTADTPVGTPCVGFTGCSLRGAVTAAEATPGADTIDVDPGTYTLTNGQLEVSQDLTVENPDPDPVANPVTISGNNASRIFYVDAGGAPVDLDLRFLTLTDGSVSDPLDAAGGAIYGEVGSTIQLESSTVQNSTATGPGDAEGGGIWSGGALTIGTAAGSTVGSVVSGNLAHSTDGGSACGGGIAAVNGDDLTVGAGTTINGNQATSLNGGLGHGGGVWFANDGQQATFTQTTISGNTASGDLALGGGVDLETGTGSFDRSTISGNIVSSGADSGLAFGGGIAVTDDATLDLLLSTVAGNTASTTGFGGSALGGGVASSFYGPVTALSAEGSTISANSVSASCGCVGGAGFFDFFGSTFTLGGTILAGNTGVGWTQCDNAAIASNGYDVLGPLGSCGYAGGPGDRTNIKNPKLKALGNYGGPTETMLPTSASPSLDLVPAADTLCTSESTDQRGSARPQGGNCDAGADEAIPATLDLSTGSIAFAYALPSTFTTDKITVTNNGELDALQPAITLGSPFSTTGGCTGPIAAGGSCTLDLKFAPLVGGAFSTVLRLRSGSARSSATLSGIGWAPTTAPSIPGTPSVGYKTSVNTGRWPAAISTISAQWWRCDADGTSNCAAIPNTHIVFRPSITGSTRTVYTPVLADAGHTLRVVLSAKSTTGVESAQLSTAASAVVTRTTPTLLQPPTVERSSAPTTGTQLSASHGQWTGAPDSYGYQWIRCDADGTTNCHDIGGKTSNKYTPGSNDVGHTLRVRVTATNPAGTSAPATSVPSGVVS